MNQLFSDFLERFGRAAAVGNADNNLEVVAAVRRSQRTGNDYPPPAGSDGGETPSARRLAADGQRAFADRLRVRAAAR